MSANEGYRGQAELDAFDARQARAAAARGAKLPPYCHLCGTLITADGMVARSKLDAATCVECEDELWDMPEVPNV